MITVSCLPNPIGDINVRRKRQTGATVYEQGDCCGIRFELSLLKFRA
jgi:hypothetical protein